MLVLVWLLILMAMRMMKGDEIITTHSGEAVLLTSDLQGAELKSRQDVRWTHSQLVMSLKSNVTTCHHGRCELLRNGSLRFSRVQAEDSGSYSLQVFDEGGKILKKRNFLLRVEDSSSSSSVLVSALMCCFLLLLLVFFIIFFIIRRRRRSQRSCMATDSLHENVYVEMHSHHGNKRKEEEKQEKEEESHYVPCIPVVSMETPITQQMSGDAEDIYV